ncbi:MAG: S8 family serine peptidase, partial [Ardenticatenaceae bacterium]
GATIEQINLDYGTTTLGTLSVTLQIYLLHVPATQDFDAVLAAMQNDPRLLYAEPNFIGRVPEGDPSDIWGWGGQDPIPFVEQYANEMINLSCAHSRSQGRRALVAVLDTGVQLDHPELESRLVAGYDFVDDDALPAEEGIPALDNAVGHGTHVAGIVHLVAPQARILPVRVLDTDGRGSAFMLAKAILYARDRDADIINLSLGMAAESELLDEVIEGDDDGDDGDGINDPRGDDDNTIYVAAAGNLNSSLAQYPAAQEGVIAVTAVGSDDVKADFANFGEWIDIAAPGVSIYSTFPPIDGSDYGYASWSGTSMATPFVAGQAALLKNARPWWSPTQIANRIYTSAVPLGPTNPDYIGLLGAGRIDAGASLGCQ